MAKEMRKVYDYFCKDQRIFQLGYVQYLKAHAPLSLHRHVNMTEFVYLERGTQKYRASNQDYLIKQGEVFFTLPNELHDTGSAPEERSVLYYLIIDLSQIQQLNLFALPEEYKSLTERFTSGNERIFRASAELPDALKNLLKCCSGKGTHFDTRIRNALSEVLIALSLPHFLPEHEPILSIERSLQYIHEHLEERIRVSDLPALDNISLSTYHKCFVQALGMPPGEYILREKIEKTKELLCQKNLSVTQIAYQYGFSSSQYFATVFKRFCNETPMQYRNKYMHSPESQDTL